MSPLMKFLSVLGLFGLLLISQCEALEVKALLLYSLTRNDGGERVVENAVTISAMTTIALLNHMNAGGLPAPKEIENPKDGYNCADVTFNFTIKDTVSNFVVALNTLNEFDLNDFDIIIGPSRSSSCVPVSFATSTFEKPVLSPICTTPELDDLNSHRFFARPIPSDDLAAKSLVKLMQDLPLGNRQPVLQPNSGAQTAVYTKVCVLYQEDTYGSKFKDKLFENSVNTGIDFIFIPFKVESAVSIINAIGEAEKTKLSVFIGILFNDNLQVLVAEALSRGMMGPNKLWVFTDGVGGTGDMLSTLQEATKRNEVGQRPLNELLQGLNNAFLVQATGRIPGNKELRQFEEDLFQLEKGYNFSAIESAITAAAVVDVDTGGDVLKPADFTDVFQSMRAERTDLVGDFSLFSYDSILIVREFIEKSLGSDGCKPNFNGTNFIKTITADDFKFDGVSGEVKLDKESGSRNEASSAMKLVNLRFLEDEESGEFRGEDLIVGIMKNTEGDDADGSRWEIDDDNIQFPGGLKTAPLLTDPPLEVERKDIGGNIEGIVFTLAAIIMLLVGGLMVFTYLSASRQVIAAAQPIFLMFMLVGVAVSTSGIFLMPQDPLQSPDEERSNAQFRCNAPFFMISLGVTISYGALVFKMKKVIKVANATPDLRSRTTASAFDTYKYFVLAIVANILVMIVCYSVVPLQLKQRVLEEDEFQQPIETFDICVPSEPDRVAVYSLFFIFHAAFYAYGFKLFSQVKNLSTDFHEGKWIALSIVSQFQLFLLGIPIVVAIGPEQPDVRFLVEGMLVIISNFVLLMLIFGPKAYRVLTGDDNIVLYAHSTTTEFALLKTHSLSKQNDDPESNDLRESERDRSVNRSLLHTMETQEFGAGDRAAKANEEGNEN